MSKAVRVLSVSSVSRPFRTAYNAERLLALFLSVCSVYAKNMAQKKTRILKTEKGFVVKFGDSVRETEKFLFDWEICELFEKYRDSRLWADHPNFTREIRVKQLITKREKEYSLGFSDESHENGDIEKLFADILRA